MFTIPDLFESIFISPTFSDAGKRIEIIVKLVGLTEL